MDSAETQLQAGNQIPRLDRTAFSVVHLNDPSGEVAYWRSKSVRERLIGLEITRRTLYGHAAATSRLQRFF